MTQKTRLAPLGAAYQQDVRVRRLKPNPDAAPNGAKPALFARGYKDFAPTELGRSIAKFPTFSDERKREPITNRSIPKLVSRATVLSVDQTFLHPQAKSDSTINETTTRLTYNKSCISSFSDSQIYHLYKPVAPIGPT